MKYEIEIKSLLGDKEAADSFRENIEQKGFAPAGGSSQLNHYFVYAKDDAEKVLSATETFLKKDVLVELKENLEKATDVSIRTRDADGNVFFVAKISVGNDTSANGTKRIEIQEKVDLTIDELDQKLIEAGLKYQAKWSRMREDFKYGDINATLDLNAGYGYLAEFEKEIQDEELVSKAHKEIVMLMDELGIEELRQDRLERMFAHYNKHWEDYYGTDKIFVIE